MNTFKEGQIVTLAKNIAMPANTVTASYPPLKKGLRLSVLHVEPRRAMPVFVSTLDGEHRFSVTVDEVVL